MKDNSTIKIKQTEGITLIALVITIIVLLILAGVTIATLTGENGILTRASDAAERTERANIIEQAQTDILGIQAEKESSQITENELETILESYGTLNGEGNILDKTLVTEKGYQIPVKDIYDGTLVREPVILEIGDYVKYDVTYTDVFTENEFTSETGWRVLETGTNNGDGTYTGLKLISTGIPAQLYYVKTTITDKEYNGAYGNWAGNESQRNAYAELFWSSYNDNNDNQNMYAAAGLYYNFTKIRFSRELDQDEYPNENEGYYININGQTEGELEETAFLKDGAIGVHNLTLAELNIARGENDLRSTSAITADDGAKGLFQLSALEEYGYNNENMWDYFLASPHTSSNALYYTSNWFGITPIIGISAVRPVIELPDNYQVEKIE